GVIHFVVSDDAVNFHDFARFFRDRLECPNALFLDGGGGAGLYDPALGRNDMSWHGGYGPMFALIE
ncbi:phosphodiester glycosidase family protein, partial [Brucella suis]